MTKHIIMQGDCTKRIKELDDESVHLVVSSPPYFVAKEYNKEQENVGNIQEYNDYLEAIAYLLGYIYDKLVPGGIIAWNTSPILVDGKRFGIPFDTHYVFEGKGFEFLEDVVWVKPDGAAKLRCGGWVQNKGKPMTWHANINTEYIMIYKKPGKREEGAFTPIREYYAETPKDLLTSTWYINPETQTTWHDAPFPEELVKRLLMLYSFNGDTIVDPFLGSGTVMKVARDMERNSIGFELSPEYIEKAKKKIGFGQASLFGNIEYEEK